MKYKQRIVWFGVAVSVLMFGWAYLVQAINEFPQCTGVDVEVISIRDSNTFRQASVMIEDKLCFARVSPQTEQGDRITVYSTDNSNYWDASEQAVFLDSVLNKTTGLLAFGIRDYGSIHILGISIAVTAWGLLLFSVVYGYLAKSRRRTL